MNRRGFLKLILQGPIFFPHLVGGGPSCRFAILADTHWPAWSVERSEILSHLSSRPIEFLIIAGDLVNLNGNAATSAFDYCSQVKTGLTELGFEWYAVPGNHDLDTGYNKPSIYVTPHQAALDAWQQHIGPLQFVKDLEHTRIIGLNFFDWTLENQTWIATQLAITKRKIVVSHYPLTGCQPKWLNQFDWFDWYHQEKLSFCQAHGVDLFICGHRHQFGLARIGTMTHLICPAVVTVAGNNLPEAAPNGTIPVTIPTRGWLEIVESSLGLIVELWRSDGLMIWQFAV